jgi:hypothetical protein
MEWNGVLMVYRFVKQDGDDGDHHNSSRVVSIAFCPAPDHPRLMDTVWKPLADATTSMAAQLVTPRANGGLPYDSAVAAAAAAAAVASPVPEASSVATATGVDGRSVPPLEPQLSRQNTNLIPGPVMGLTINPSMSTDDRYVTQTPIPPSPMITAEHAAAIAAKEMAIRRGIENDRRSLLLLHQLYCCYLGNEHVNDIGTGRCH